MDRGRLGLNLTDGTPESFGGGQVGTVLIDGR
jgi:hypothetical protein